VYMAADGAIAAGTVVKIGGLVGARERNGKLGLVEGFDAAKGRYVVRLTGEAVGTTITMNLKMSNVQPSTGVAALQFAASIGDIAAMGQLLDGGADPNALVPLGVEDPTRPGQKMRMTALTTALGYKQDAAVQLLLERGADPGLAVSTGLTPLILASIHGSLAAVQLLLAQKVALDCVCRLSGGTAFHYACSGGHVDVAVALVRAGCDTTMRGKDDMTGRDQAIHAGHTAVVRAIDVAAASGAAGGESQPPEPEQSAAAELLAAGTAVEIAGLDPISLLLGWIRASRTAWARHHS
jgi:hypothetical protein